MANTYFVSIRSIEYPEANAVWFCQKFNSSVGLKKSLEKVISDDGLYVSRVIKAKSDFRPALTDSEYFRIAISTMYSNVKSAKKERRRKKIRHFLGFFKGNKTAC